MGLDITALQDAKRERVLNEDDGYDRGLTHAYVNADFAERADGLEDGFYSSEDDFGFRAGSYSGYGYWREWLSQTFLGVLPRSVWDDPEAFAGRPFFELIHFSDCEGIIGPNVAAKLAKDFEDGRTQVVAAAESMVAVYNDFARAFKMAAQNGLVIFH